MEISAQSYWDSSICIAIKKCTWSPAEDHVIRSNFTKEARARLSDMFSDAQKEGLPPDWLGADYWKQLDRYWSLRRCNRSFGSLLEQFSLIPERGSGLDLSANKFTGSIPLSFGNVNPNQLRSDDLNFLTPLTNCSRLQFLDIAYNQFTGEFPGSISNLSSQLSWLNFYNNSIHRSIPAEFANLLDLTALGMGLNFLTGNIPASLGKLPMLKVLYLGSNQLTGEIPSSLGNLTHLLYLYLHNNSLEGTIPSGFGNFKFLQEVGLSRNSLNGTISKQFIGLSSLSRTFNLLSGDIPNEIGQCFSLNKLYLDMPNEIGQCFSLNKLYLQSNLFQGAIPYTGQLARIEYLDLSNNRLSGQMPRDLVKLHLLLNLNLLFNNLEGDVPLDVYVGALPPSEVAIAVKVLNLQQKGASKSFLAECQALRNIRHRNLVKVLSVCSSSDFQGNDFKALIYQFMPNWSLDKWLHPQERQCGYASLDILQRINVAADVASALHYLHYQCPTTVIHCDLKPSNVLLDNNLTAHISDFGIARLLVKFNRETDVNQFSSPVVKGTIGYIAPGYVL
ncbi:putative receptor-like protein kinase At3g47110 [Lycium barbarum]|uniref:putative receptor-like protein kinase At3g47110 n=1 Tax=Lycium barbarum TaxID=112863 RepID=UPI00293E747D|nr:putative receptor-like protein kinase At3g47110 [Lycium barbarum]